MFVKRFPYLLRKHPYMPTRFLLPLPPPDFPIQFPRFYPQEILPHLQSQELRDQSQEGYRRGKGHESCEEFRDSKAQHQEESVWLVGEHIEQMGQPTEDYEGTKLEDYPFEGEEGGASGEVQELKGDGEVGCGNEKVTDFLALEDRFNAPEAITVTIAAADLDGGCTKD